MVAMEKKKGGMERGGKKSPPMLKSMCWEKRSRNRGGTQIAHSGRHFQKGAISSKRIERAHYCTLNAGREKVLHRKDALVHVKGRGKGTFSPKKLGNGERRKINHCEESTWEREEKAGGK